MITTFAFFERKHGLERDGFIRHWRDVHGPLIATIDYIRGYTQDHPSDLAAPDVFADPWFQGIAQFWWDDRAAAARPATDPAFTELGSIDEPNFLHQPSLVGVESRPVKLAGGSRPPADGSPKLMVCVSRALGADEATFEDSLTRFGQKLAIEAGAERALLHLTVTDAPNEFDAVFEFWWSDVAAYERWRDSRSVADLSAMPGIDSGSSTMYVATEHTVVPIVF